MKWKGTSDFSERSLNDERVLQKKKIFFFFFFITQPSLISSHLISCI